MSAPYQTMPPLTKDELRQLEDSILAHGIQVPVLVDEHGATIDGHNRLEIAERHGLDCPTVMRGGLTEADKIALSISLNIDRRQLTREQRREIIAQSITAHPELTDREHARRTGTSPTTVGTLRAKLEDEGEVSKLDTRTDPRGYEQPAAKPAVQRITETQTIQHVTETPVPEPTQAPVAEGVTATEQNARNTVREIARSLETLLGFTYQAYRARIITEWWDLGSADVPPSQADLFTPDRLRALAQGLTDTATALEAHRG
ncbi:ParB N-terminal domain-containing protein [Leucobacter salsicius]|uniref:ParB N-terminal domain-containing protein n=1 Tax=Leucobacter salsicius TaxID=664638 RepID=UPI0003462E86|nr:ParB/RepB/Spo0J family partition protein [Leucobacter salsicius]